MDERTSFWLVSAEAAMAERVRSALNGDATRLGPLGVCEEVQEVVGQLERQPRSLVLVDIDPAPRQHMAALEPIINRFDGARFVVLCSQVSNELVLEAMQVGARHFLGKGAIGAELAGVIRRLTPNGAAAGQAQGRVVTVLSASGGCGATTVAVNLANELRLRQDEPTLLVDLDVYHGGVGTYLGLEGDYGVADLLAQAQRIDPVLVRSTAQSGAPNLDTLLSPATVNFADPLPIQVQALHSALHAFNQSYRWTVIDAPRAPMPTASTLATGSRIVLIVCQLTVKDVRMAAAIRQRLISEGVCDEAIWCVANRYRRRAAMVSLDLARRSLSGGRLERLRNDYRSAVRSINYGQPLAETAKRSPLRRDLCKLAEQVAEAAGQGAPSYAGETR